MKTLKYAAFLSLPLAFAATTAHADIHSADARGSFRAECELLLHGDVSTLGMTEYQARWNECLGEAKRAEVKKAEITCDPEAVHDRERHDRG